MIKKIFIEKDTRDVDLDKTQFIGLGVKEDNKIDTIVFQFDEFVDGTATLLTNIVGEDGVLAPFPLTKNAEEKTYTLEVVEQMLINDVIEMQLEIILEEDKVWHSKLFSLVVYDKLETGTGTMPSGVDNWLIEANKRIEQIDEVINNTKEYEEKIKELEEQIDEFNQYDYLILE